MAWFDDAGEFAIQIATRLANWNDLEFCAITHVQLASPNDKTDQEKRFLRAREIILQIPDERCVSAGWQIWMSNRTSSRYQAESLPLTKTSKYYRDMASGLGVDLKNVQDPIAQIINIGLADLNRFAIANISLFHTAIAEFQPKCLVFQPRAASYCIVRNATLT